MLEWGIDDTGGLLWLAPVVKPGGGVGLVCGLVLVSSGDDVDAPNFLDAVQVVGYVSSIEVIGILFESKLSLPKITGSFGAENEL